MYQATRSCCEFFEGQVLEQWLVRLHRGSLLSNVDRIDVQWGVAPAADMTQKSFDSFDIVF